jgi:DNA-binding CsgD family transcriptional regulator/tetratricopeptide (TPR) repeat protein
MVESQRGIGMLPFMAARVSSPVLVGRDAELQTIAGALDRAAPGETVDLLIAGEAGVGKTRLTAEAARLARERGFRVLRGDCGNVGGTGLPFGPFVEALRELAADLDPAEIAAIAGPAADDLARLVPAFGSSGDAPSQSEWVQSRVFEALLGFFTRLAERSPVLFVVEDLHWADSATRDTVAFMVRALRDVPFVLVGTFRSDELHRRHALLPWLAELERTGRVERIDLARLDRTELAVLLTAILGERPPAELVEDVFSRSDGNPFFAEELLAASHEGRAGGRLPPTLREILLAHIAVVPDSATAVLRVAAVAGRRVEHDLLAEVAALPEETLHEGLRAAVGGHLLIVESDAGPERYAFRHALVQEVVYDELLPGERRNLHRAFAEALDARVPGRGASEAGHWAELAHHWAAARQDDRAFDASLRAAGAAMSSFAFGAALLGYERALELWDGIDDPGAVAGIDRLELLRRAGLAALLAADYRRAVAHRREAVRGADATVDPVRAGLLREELGRALWVLGDSAASLEAYRDALATIPAQPPTAERARAVSGFGQILMLRSRYEESRALCEEAIAIARAVGARAQEGHALNTLGLDLASLSDRSGVDALEEALRIAREVHNPDDIGRAFVNLGEALNLCDETAAAVEVTVQGISETEELGISHSYGHYIRLCAVTYEYALGHWDRARRILDEALARAPTGTGAELYRLARSVQLFVGEGAMDPADTAIARAFALIGDNPDAQFVGPVHAAAAERELWLHEPRAALDIVERGVARLAETDDVYWACHLSRIGAWAAADIADDGRARRDASAGVEARERLDRLRVALDRAADAAPPEAARRSKADRVSRTDRASLEAEARRLDGTPDSTAWARLAEAWAALDRPYLKAYARWREGEAWLEMGDRAAAAVALRSARALADELDARPLLEAVEALGRRARIGLAAPEPAETGEAPDAHDEDPFGLTPREREVLALVADGRTNRQIAEHLFISESTAGVHVSNILGKLGVASRVEAASIAFRLRLVTPGIESGAPS